MNEEEKSGFTNVERQNSEIHASGFEHSESINLAIIRTSSIGDVVLATSLIKLFDVIGIPCQITWLAGRATSSFLQASHPDLKIVPFQSVKVFEINTKFVQTHELDKVDFIVDLQRNMRSIFLTSFLKRWFEIPFFSMDKGQFDRNKKIFASAFSSRDSKLSRKEIEPKQLQYQNMLAPLIDALKSKSIALTSDDLEQVRPYTPTSLQPSPVAKEFDMGLWIAIAPGGSYDTKRAPARVFQLIIENILRKLSLLSDDLEIGIVFIGDENDRQTAQKIIDLSMGLDKYVNLSGKLNLVECAEVLKKMSLLVTNDSALLHIAESVDTNVCALFGPTIESFGFAPHLPDSKAFSSTIGCRPCSKHGKTPCRYGDKRCFEDLSIAEITNHALFLIEKNRKNAK